MKELLQDFLLVKKEEIKEETKGGFIKPGGHKEKQSVAIVKQIGEKVNKIRQAEELSDMEVGQRVLCGDHSIRELQIDGEKYNFIRYKDLISIIS